MKHAECVLACVFVRERKRVGGRRGVKVCVSVSACTERRGECDPLLFIWHKMTSTVTLDIIRVGYGGQIQWPNRQVKLSKLTKNDFRTRTHL